MRPMCNRYRAPDVQEIERYWNVRPRANVFWASEVHPRSMAPFVRQSTDGNRELVVGHWGLIPHFAETARLRWQTNNARSEELTRKPTFRHSWTQGQRCIIPAASFDEPCWETGKNVWWRFTRADGAPWALAGLWNIWTDPEIGEMLESYTMLTINADSHPLMRRMHKPDTKLPTDAQDKRSVIVIEQPDLQTWLGGTKIQAQELMRLAPAEVFAARPISSIESLRIQ